MNGTLEKHRPADLALFHRNPRRGDTAVIAASLRANGQYKPVVVNRGTHTGRPLEVLAGNHTVKAFRDLATNYPDEDRWQEIDCWVVDVDNDQASRIVTVDNRAADLGSYDDAVLADLLSDLPDLEGTGYDYDDLDALLADEDDGEEGAPGAGDFLDPEDDKYVEQYAVTVICSDEDHQRTVYESLTEQGYNVRVVTV